jgi:glutaminase
MTTEDYEREIEATKEMYEREFEELKEMNEALCKLNQALGSVNSDLTRALDKYEAQATYLRDVLLGLSGEIQWY